MGLLVSERYSTMLVMVDRLSKQAHFGALPRSYSAPRVANLFVQMVCRLRGIPRSIMSDKDAIFLGRFWCELFTLNNFEAEYNLPSTNGWVIRGD